MTYHSFADYKEENRSWITLARSEFYPDYLPQAKNFYGPVLVEFHALLTTAPNSAQLYRNIMATQSTWMRTQLCRVFRKYISPSTPVELLKRKIATEQTIKDFQQQFRNIAAAQTAFEARPNPDESLCALMWEYKDRGRSGYDLTQELFGILRNQLSGLEILGPEGAGRDIQLQEVWPDYPSESRPVDFVIRKADQILAIGLARYDGDRGGAQEDDRIGQYREVAQEIIQYCDNHELPSTKVIYVNDGPGLLTGSMWDDYSKLDTLIGNRIRVATLRMVPERITIEWLRS